LLRKAFIINREEVTGHWRQLHNGELHDLCCSPKTYYSGDQIEKNEVGGACRMYGEKCIRAVARTPERRGPLLILGRRWDGSVQMDLKQIGCEDLNWLRIWTRGEFL
jgi:hypothetical protein